MTSHHLVRVQDALIPAALNALINGGIAWFGFKALPAVPLTLDLISAKQHTVWGEGVTLAFALGLILTLITAKMFSKHVIKEDPSLAARVRRPIFPFVMGVALGNAMALFGWFVALAVLWQRVVGTVEVSPALAASLVGLLAGVITIVVEMRTKRALLGSTA
ncbi:hypothetical protein [Roseateles albus]|uniref:Permease n=1 Tax=Roseateles albus TaxID=2987525 RepID=A0ABT5KGJ2_9BURK|nr:hypothetical protein [Roseateles albus]MDC8773018.1 hypothetical protein [Roseateles albus]